MCHNNLSLWNNLITACPIKGQIRKECASHPSCHQTCNTSNPESLPCPAICINNGCECPEGTVIDQEKKECVAPYECEGTYMLLSQPTSMFILGTYQFDMYLNWK